MRRTRHGLFSRGQGRGHAVQADQARLPEPGDVHLAGEGNAGTPQPPADAHQLSHAFAHRHGSQVDRALARDDQVCLADFIQQPAQSGEQAKAGFEAGRGEAAEAESQAARRA